MAPSTPPATLSPPRVAPSSSQTTSTLPHINTNASPVPLMQRQSSLAKDRLSTYSMGSQNSRKGSRPVSHVSTQLRSSLAYAQVRDFAYPATTPLHYGPPPVSSATASRSSTPPVDRQARAKDLPSTGSAPARASWTAGAWAGRNVQLPRVAYTGGPDDHGPPYSEDEDLHSPVVVTSRHRHDYGQDRSFFTGVNGDGSETYYMSGVDDMADGPGGELVTYDANDPRHSKSVLSPEAYQRLRRLEPSSAGSDDSRYSRDYQFTIASPDEEMHGKAVALFDFARENENELPLVEGQVIWVSYRHGQGWLVAEDPRTRESGLVPEEYVRLLRDIEGGLNSLSSENSGMAIDTDETASSPTTTDGDTSIMSPGGTTRPSHHRAGSSSGEKQPPVLSTFSTSSKDLDPYPHPLNTGQSPPQIVHYGSQPNASQPASPDVARNGGGKDMKRTSSNRSGRSAKGKRSSMR